MTNLYNIRSIRLSGKVATGIKDTEITGDQDWSATQLVSMAAIRPLFERSNTKYVEYTDMIQNGCWYYDGAKGYTDEELEKYGVTKVENYVYHSEIYYGFIVGIEYDENNDPIDGYITVDKADIYASRVLIPVYLREITNDTIVEINYSMSTTLNFLQPSRVKKFVVTDNFTISDGTIITLPGMGHVTTFDPENNEIYNYNENIELVASGQDLLIRVKQTP